MKPVSKYISLLMIGGLMLPLYDTYNNIGEKIITPSCREKVQSAKVRDYKMDKGGFSFFKDVILNLTPVLKNLK